MSKSNIERDWETAAGLRAVVLLTYMGHRCGYVGVAKEHPLYGIGYYESAPSVLTKDADDFDNSPEAVFDVHGGITYANGRDDYPVTSDGMWWFGFDAAHAGDDHVNGGRPLDYMVSECESLARQITERVRVEG